MSQSTSVAVVSTPQTQQVATTQPARTSLATKLFGGSMKGDEPVAVTKRVASQAEIAEWRSTIAKQEAADRAELTRRMQPQHIEAAQRMYQAFKTPELEQYIKESGQGAQPELHFLLARAWVHLSAVEKERDALRQEVAWLRGGRR